MTLLLRSDIDLALHSLHVFAQVIQVGNWIILTLPVVLKAELMIFFLNATVTTNSLSFSRRLVSLATRSRQNGLALLQIVFIVRNHLTDFLQHNNNLTGCNEWPAMDAVLPLVPNCYWQRSWQVWIVRQIRTVVHSTCFVPGIEFHTFFIKKSSDCTKNLMKLSQNSSQMNLKWMKNCRSKCRSSFTGKSMLINNMPNPATKAPCKLLGI